MRALVRNEIIEALESLRSEGWTLPPTIDVPLDRPKRAEHGDLATNVAMSLTKSSGRKPREIAEAIVAKLRNDDPARAIASAEIAGPGFINLRIRDAAYQRVIDTVFAERERFGHAHAQHPGRTLVEFVSANPTGPLHIAHARGAVVGDALVRVMRAAGHDVATEYYVNDSGQKVLNLALTVRCIVHGQALWSEAYKGEYVEALAAELKRERPDLVAQPVQFEGEGDARKAKNAASDRELAACAVARMMDSIRATLDRLGVRFDAYFSEQTVVADGRVPKLVADWMARGLAEEREGAIFFKTSQTSEEDKDRVLRKSSGDYTYFAADIAYHADKLARGYSHLINVLGADHHGYVPRMRAAIEALGLPKRAFEALLMQMVSLIKDGKPYKMAKTAGTFVTIDEVVDEIDHAAQTPGAGRDALRYFLLMRSSDSPMEIDIDLAKKQTVDNPVFYAQMSHARMCQVIERARSAPEFADARERGLLTVPTAFDATLARKLVLPEERELLDACDAFPLLVRDAAAGRAPHRVLFFVQELAQSFASYYTRLQKVHHDAILPQRSQREAGDWIDRWDWDKTRARLMWLEAVRQVYANALALLGVDAPRRMARLGEASASGSLDES